MTVTGGCGTSGGTHVRPSAAQLVGITRLALVVQGESAFDVMDARAKVSSPGGVVAVPAGGGAGGGAAALAIVIVMLIAYGAATASARSEDSATAAKLHPRMHELSPGAVVPESFMEALRSGGRFEVEVIQTPPSKEEQPAVDAIVFLEFPTWGFELLRTDTPSLTAFVDVDARMVRARDGKRLWAQKERMLGHGRQTVDELKEDPERLRRELRDTLEATGYRLAVDLLYPEGKP